MDTPEPFGLPGSREALTRAEAAPPPTRKRAVHLHLLGGDVLAAGPMDEAAIERFRVWVDERGRPDGQVEQVTDTTDHVQYDRHHRTVRFTEPGAGMVSEWIVPVDKIVAVEVRPA